MRRFTFCAGHRLVGHEGKCQNLHGHNYVVEIYVTGAQQDAIGRILDFKLLKNRVKDWIDDNWDHTFILWNQDENGLAAIRSSEPHRIYELDANPTAENMAIHLLEEICPKILDGTGATAFKIRLWESEETCAEVTVGQMQTYELNHVAIHVENVEKSVEFYRDALKLKPLPRPDFDFPGAWFQLGTTQELHIIGDRDLPVHSHHRGGHFALIVDSLDEWESHLDAYGAKRLQRKTRPDGAFQTFVQDPDGHWIELCMLNP